LNKGCGGVKLGYLGGAWERILASERKDKREKGRGGVLELFKKGGKSARFRNPKPSIRKVIEGRGTTELEKVQIA